MKVKKEKNKEKEKEKKEETKVERKEEKKEEVKIPTRPFHGAVREIDYTTEFLFEKKWKPIYSYKKRKRQWVPLTKEEKLQAT